MMDERSIKNLQQVVREIAERRVTVVALVGMNDEGEMIIIKSLGAEEDSDTNIEAWMLHGLLTLFAEKNGEYDHQSVYQTGKGEVTDGKVQ